MNERESQEQVHQAAPGTSVASRASEDAERPVAGIAPVGLDAPSGIADPDYARVFTQARIIAWQHGFALLAHGSFSRDLDLLMVPWEARAYDKIIPAVINRIAQVTGTSLKGDPGDKPHGRKAYTLFLPDMVRWVDLSVMPCQRPIQLQGVASPQGATLDAEAAKPIASNGPDGPASAAISASLPALLLQAVEALECNAMWAEGSEAHPRLLSIAAALRQRIGRE